MSNKRSVDQVYNRIRVPMVVGKRRRDNRLDDEVVTTMEYLKCLDVEYRYCDDGIIIPLSGITSLLGLLQAARISQELMEI